MASTAVRFAIAALCLAGTLGDVLGLISDTEDVAYTMARRNYDAQDTTLTLLGATVMVREYTSRINLTCRTTVTCEQCFNLTRLDGITTSLLDQNYFRAVASWLLLASLTNGASGSNGTSCPYPGVGIINITQPMNDLIVLYRSGGITAGEQLKTILSSLRTIYRGASSCFSVNRLLTQIGISNDTVSVPDELIAQLLSYTFINMAKGHIILDNCPMQPTELQIASDLMELLDVHSKALSLQDLSSVMQIVTTGANSSQTTDGTQPGNPAQMCLSPEQLLAAYGFEAMDGSTTMPADQLLVMSPGLLQQKLGGYCAQSSTEEDVEPIDKPTLAETYGYGTLTIFIISLLPLLGMLLLPCMKTRAGDHILTLFTALAIGTMLSDALLHILPEILGDSTEYVGSVSENLLEVVTTFIGAYVFFLLEMSLHIARKKMNTVQDGGDESNTDRGESRSHAVSHGHSHFDARDLGLTMSTKEENSIGNSGSSSNMIEQSRRRAVSFGSLKPLAVIVLAGDLLHNCADGLAVGAGFATSIHMGISLGIAVCCHEVPHEIGNFAVLLAAGIEKWKVLGLSLFSSTSCFLGLYIGASVGSNEMAAEFIFAVTAATFFYISLVDLLPSLIHKSTSTPLLHFLMINIGLLLGFAIMFLFAIYEDLITV